MMELIKEYKSDPDSDEFSFIAAGLSIMYDTPRSLKDKLEQHKRSIEKMLKEAGSYNVDSVFDKDKVKQSISSQSTNK